jgi:hypothetical protein
VLSLFRSDAQEALMAYGDIDCKALFCGSFASNYH